MRTSQPSPPTLLLQAFDEQILRQHHAAWLLGIDEAGRGALAGPVFAAAVALNEAFYRNETPAASAVVFNDSKKLSFSERQEAYLQLKDWEAQGQLHLACAYATVPEIETLNIWGATQLAAQRALQLLGPRVHLPCEENFFSALSPREAPQTPATALILVDGRPMPRLGYPHQALVKGDSRSLAIAMASVVAKVQRDAWMTQLAADFPPYGFERHKGYGTAFHTQQLGQHGPSPVHRPSFLKPTHSAPQKMDLLSPEFQL